MAIHSGLAMELPANTLLRGLEADPAERPKLKMAEGPFPIDELRLESAKRGDRDALQKLLDPMRPKLTAFFWRRVHDADEAENLTQLTLIQAYEQLERFRGECPFDRWVWCIAANVAAQFYRARTRNARFSAELTEDAGMAICDETELQTEGWLRQMLAAAKEACSEQEFTVMMTYYQVGSFDKVATLLEMNAATVRSCFLRGRSALLAYLIRFCPDSVGGMTEILAAAKRMLEQSGDRALDPGEYDALKNGRYPSKLYRSACLKVARTLPNPVQGS
jgi:RNA polymerase sigma-70 factor, ECF subfamily